MNTTAKQKSHVLLPAVMTKSGLPKSIRKFIRKEKARIRGGIFSTKEQKGQIAKLYAPHVSPAKTTSHEEKSHPEESPAVKPVATKEEETVSVKKQVKKATSKRGEKSKARKPKA